MWAAIHGIRKYLCGIGVLLDSGRGKSDATGILWKEKAWRKLLLLLAGGSFTPRSGGLWAVPHEVVGTMSSTLANGVEIEAVGDW